MNTDTIRQIIEMATYGEKVMFLCPRGTEVDRVRKEVRKQIDEVSFSDSFTLKKEYFKHQSGGSIFFKVAKHWNDSTPLKGFDLDHCFIVNPKVWVELESKQTNINYLFT